MSDTLSFFGRSSHSRPRVPFPTPKLTLQMPEPPPVTKATFPRSNSVLVVGHLLVRNKENERPKRKSKSSVLSLSRPGDYRQGNYLKTEVVAGTVFKPPFIFQLFFSVGEGECVVADGTEELRLSAVG